MASSLKCCLFRHKLIMKMLIFFYFCLFQFFGLFKYFFHIIFFIIITCSAWQFIFFISYLI